MEEILSKAIRLREDGQVEDSIEIFEKYLIENPENPEANYQCAWAHDVAEKEREAIKYYKKAIEYGLKGKKLESAYLGLGSTYRAIGDFLNSERIFLKAMEVFTTNLEFKVFYAMTLYNLKQHKKAMEILLKIIADTSKDENIIAYKKAIDFYSDKLDEVW